MFPKYFPHIRIISEMAGVQILGLFQNKKENSPAKGFLWAYFGQIITPYHLEISYTVNIGTIQHILRKPEIEENLGGPQPP